MALFGKKKQEDDGSEEEDAKAFTPQPEKAKRWLDQAKHIADTGNFTYASDHNGNFLSPRTSPNFGTGAGSANPDCDRGGEYGRLWTKSFDEIFG